MRRDRRRCRRAAATVVLALAATAAPARAQQESLEIVPTVGILIPTGTLTRGVVTPPGGIPVPLAISQETGPLVGARVTAWWSTDWGWEVRFDQAYGDAEVEGEGVGSFCDGAGELECGANVWIASSRVLRRFGLGPGAPWSLHAGLGVTVVGHTGEFWRRGEATTDLGLSAGLGVALELSQRLALRLDADDHVYRFRPEIRDDPVLGTVDSGQRLQNDVVVSVAVAIRLHGR